MTGATHFIAQFRDIRNPVGEVGNSGVTPIGLLQTALNASKVSTNYKTVAVFRIKLKAQVMVAHFDEQLKATIIQ